MIDLLWSKGRYDGSIPREEMVQIHCLVMFRRGSYENGKNVLFVRLVDITETVLPNHDCLSPSVKSLSVS